jgi:hypothetical protein
MSKRVAHHALLPLVVGSTTTWAQRGVTDIAGRIVEAPERIARTSIMGGEPVTIGAAIQVEYCLL